MTLEPGLEAAFRYTVTEADTAAAVSSGQVSVLATHRCSPWPSGPPWPRSPAPWRRARPWSAPGRAGPPGPQPGRGRPGGQQGAGAGRRPAAGVRRPPARRRPAGRQRSRHSGGGGHRRLPPRRRRRSRHVSGLRVVAERAVGAPAEHVCRCTADFDRHHPRFLPPEPDGDSHYQRDQGHSTSSAPAPP
jgi:hypothetical protein